MANKKISDLSAGTISGTQLLFNGDPSTGALTKNTFNDLQTFLGGTKIYAAVITQSSTGAPTATIAFNNTGTTITFARTTTGIYTATAGSAIFTSGKTIVFLQNVFDTSIVSAAIASTTLINIRTVNAGSFSGQDGLLSVSSFKIEIYP